MFVKGFQLPDDNEVPEHMDHGQTAQDSPEHDIQYPDIPMLEPQAVAAISGAFSSM